MDAILVTSNDTIISANSAALRMFGMTEKEITKVGGQDLVVNDEHLVKALEERARTGRMNAELTCRRKDGSTFEGEVTSSFFTDADGTTKASMTIRNVTERKKTEKAYREAQSKLQEYNSRFTLKLLEDRAKQAKTQSERFLELERELQDKERLAAIGETAGMAGHDIRNPLQAIAGDSYLLKEYLDGLPDSDTKVNAMESLDGIEKNIGYINKIVADLLDYARPLRPEYHIANLVDIVAETLKGVDIPHNIRVTNASEEIKLRTDPQFVRRALTNLLNNAVQAMPNGGSLKIEAHEKEKRVLLTVQDTGVGIPRRS